MGTHPKRAPGKNNFFFKLPHDQIAPKNSKTCMTWGHVFLNWVLMLSVKCVLSSVKILKCLSLAYRYCPSMCRITSSFQYKWFRVGSRWYKLKIYFKNGLQITNQASIYICFSSKLNNIIQMKKVLILFAKMNLT